MAKTRVDVDSVLGKLVQGISTTQIAKEYGVSRQAIDLWRKRFIKEGYLTEKKESRSIKDMVQTHDYETIVSTNINEWLNEILLQRIEKKIFESVMIADEAQNKDKLTRLLEEVVHSLKDRGYKKEIRNQEKLFLELIKTNAGLVQQKKEHSEELMKYIEMSQELLERSKRKSEIGEI